jgi:signal transduction histidine kinase
MPERDGLPAVVGGGPLDEQDAAEVQWLKKEAISALSHQMRTPLAAIKGYATALLLQWREYDDETRQEFLQVIAEETDRLSKLVGDVLESAAAEAGLLHLEPQPLLLARLAADIASRLAQLHPEHRFVVSFPPHFPVVAADPAQIEQVLQNLLDNAVKYSPNGGLIVVRGEATPAAAVVSVADQGTGIAPEHLNRLFERFYRVPGAGEASHRGTGLGLPIARAIVEAHGGRIWAESAPDKGSVFHFTVPRRVEAPPDEDRGEPA